MGELTNSITAYYRFSVIDYLYPYKMPSSLVDQAFLASSDKMFPLNHWSKANNTVKYMREIKKEKQKETVVIIPSIHLIKLFCVIHPFTHSFIC